MKILRKKVNSNKKRLQFHLMKKLLDTIFAM